MAPPTADSASHSLPATVLPAHLETATKLIQQRLSAFPRALAECLRPVQVVAFHMKTTRKYFMPEGSVSDKSLAAFAAGVVDGSVQAHFKSDAVPTGGPRPVA